MKFFKFNYLDGNIKKTGVIKAKNFQHFFHKAIQSLGHECVKSISSVRLAENYKGPTVKIGQMLEKHF